MSTTPAERPGLASYLLGLFIAWQLLFLAADNYLDLLWRIRPPDELGEQLRSGLKSWERLTGQTQYWSLFAPHVEVSSRFAAVAVVSDGERHELLSQFETPSRQFLRLPGGSDRLFNYEQNTMVRLYLPWDEATVAQEPDTYRQERHDALRKHGRPALAYLRWRWAEFRREHPELPPPTELILQLRVYPIPAPGTPWQWQEPLVRPLARWRPDSNNAMPLEAYDPVKRRFETVFPARTAASEPPA